VIKNLPSSTPVPHFLKGCKVNGVYVAEGEPVMPLQLAAGPGNNNTKVNPCQTCFCMGGTVRCRTLECDRPIDGCHPVTEDGHCCPDRYECDVPAVEESVPTTTVDTLLVTDNFLNDDVEELTEQPDIFIHTTEIPEEVDDTQYSEVRVSVFFSCFD